MELTLDQALQKGIEAHKAGKAKEADQYYTAILKANPKHPDANHNMGVLAVGVGKVEAALPFFKTAVEANPSIAQYWLSYIDALIKLDRTTDAKAVFNQAKNNGAKGAGFDQLEKLLGISEAMINSEVKGPSEQQIKNLRRMCLQGKHQEALNAAAPLLKQYPNSLFLCNIIGVANKGLGKLDESVLAYKKALLLKPDYAKAFYNMGNVLKEQGKLEEAIEAYKKAISIIPNSTEAYNNMGNALLYQGNLTEANEAYKKALSINPDNAEAHNNMGNVLKEQEMLDSAIEAYKKAISIKPDYAEAYNNMGAALKDQGELEKAIEAYKKAISVIPNYAEAYKNIGVTFQQQRKLEEAIDAYKKALSIKPDNAEAYYNMGIAFKSQGKPEAALDAYNKALSIKSDYAEAYNNMGAVLNEQGKLEEAIEALNKALSIRPDYAEAWNNLYFPIQAIKTKVCVGGDIELHYPTNVYSNYAKTELYILDFKLHRGQESYSIYLDKVMSSLSSSDNITLQNPKFNKNTQEKIQDLPDKMVALVHFGRSGTGLMHSLIDGHPEISTLPGIYFSEYFDHSTWTKIISDGWNGMADQFAAIYDVLFDASSAVPVTAKSKELIYNIGIKDGMANVGDHKDEVLGVDKDLFKTELRRLIATYDELDAFLFFKLVHKAYDKALNDHNFKSLVFYHVHNPDTYAQLNFVRLNPSANWILMVREPIQSCESWIRRSFGKNDHFGVVSRILTMLFEIDNPVYSGQNALGVRLEDLKIKPQITIPALCEWLGIQENASLYEMTAQGKRWWGDPSSPDYEKDGQDPFGKTSIGRKVGSIFSNRDQFIFRTLFYPFSVRYGYVNENLDQFKADLQTIRPLLDETFDFEKKIMKQISSGVDSFLTSGSYLYLRSGLIERWNTLDKFQTYPNMIRLLKI